MGGEWEREVGGEHNISWRDRHLFLFDKETFMAIHLRF